MSCAIFSSDISVVPTQQDLFCYRGHLVGVPLLVALETNSTIVDVDECRNFLACDEVIRDGVSVEPFVDVQDLLSGDDRRIGCPPRRGEARSPGDDPIAFIS